MFEKDSIVRFLADFKSAKQGDFAVIENVYPDELEYDVRLSNTQGKKVIHLLNVPEKCLSLELIPFTKADLHTMFKDNVENTTHATLSPYTLFDSNYDYTIYTDVATDYEALSKNPVYYEFVDLGKALNKLRYIEHHQQPIKNVDKETLYIGKTIFALCKEGVNPVLVKSIDIKSSEGSGFRADFTGLGMQGLPVVGYGSLCFDNFKEALDALGLPF